MMPPPISSTSTFLGSAAWAAPVNKAKTTPDTNRRMAFIMDGSTSLFGGDARRKDMLPSMRKPLRAVRSLGRKRHWRQAATKSLRDSLAHDRRRRLGADVVGDAVDAAHFIDDAPRHLL